MAGFDESRLYSDKPGKVLFFNYINGCRQDVVNLKKKMTNLGWICEDVNADSLKDLRNISEGKGKSYSGTIMVFFFGYGYEDQLFLGLSTDESVSYKIFYQELKKFQTRDEALIVFTNSCFKKPNKTTYEYVEVDNLAWDVFHFCIKTNGKCQVGSLMANVILNKLEDLRYDFLEFATKFTGEINNPTDWEGDVCCAYWVCYGTSKNIFINFKPPSKIKRKRESERERELKKK